VSPSSGGGCEAPTEAADRPPLSSWTSYFEFRAVGPTASVTEFCFLYETQRVVFFVPRRDGQIPETKQFYVKLLSSSTVR